MKTDYFAEFRTPKENAGNKGNRVTTHERPVETNDFPREGSVTQKSGGRVTRVTRPSRPEIAEESVTRVTRALEDRVTGPEVQKPAENQVISESVTHVTRVTRENDGASENGRAEIARVAHLDDERRDADRSAKRGYDLDPGAPSHAEYLSRTDPSESRSQHHDMPARTVAPNSRHPLVESAVRAKLEAIEAEARAKGWPAELLWNAGFWDCPRGLAAVLDLEDEIVEVTPEYIAILKTRRDLLKFRRHAA
jgi:hypothetical protein